mmetsp:Transcript_16790/g.48244  ORF Transcript_16790/g.48244 Transcript_16790/m.48244 type:complete len:287 (+) Transcript_16790:167-1027(+)
MRLPPNRRRLRTPTRRWPTRKATTPPTRSCSSSSSSIRRITTRSLPPSRPPSRLPRPRAGSTSSRRNMPRCSRPRSSSRRSSRPNSSSNSRLRLRAREEVFPDTSIASVRTSGAARQSPRRPPPTRTISRWPPPLPLPATPRLRPLDPRRPSAEHPRRTTPISIRPRPCPGPSRGGRPGRCCSSTSIHSSTHSRRPSFPRATPEPSPSTTHRIPIIILLTIQERLLLWPIRARASTALLLSTSVVHLPRPTPDTIRPWWPWSSTPAEWQPRPPGGPPIMAGPMPAV